MSEYTDEWGRYHDKPCINNAYSSNNGWNSTAIAKFLDLPIYPHGLTYCYSECKRSDTPLVIDRSPKDLLPPMSHDEIVALIILELLDPELVIKSNFNYCNLPSPDPSIDPRKPLTFTTLYKALRAAWKIRPTWLRIDGTKAHRNDLWDQPDLWCLGFKLSIQNQWFVLTKAGHWTPWLMDLYTAASHLITAKFGSNSGKIRLWTRLKSLGLENSFTYRQLKWKDAIVSEFGPVHDFTKVIEGRG
jgi:hypothetical protein